MRKKCISVSCFIEQGPVKNYMISNYIMIDTKCIGNDAEIPE